MKIQQWQLRKVPEPRTLADVPDGVHHTCVAGVFSGRLMVMHRKGNKAFYTRSDGREEDDSLLPPREFKLYTQPSRPKTLEDVPDRRVINARWQLDGEWESFLIFRHDKRWLDLRGQPGFQGYADPQWQLTDCVVELVETEVELVETEVGVIG